MLGFWAFRIQAPFVLSDCLTSIKSSPGLTVQLLICYLKNKARIFLRAFVCVVVCLESDVILEDGVPLLQHDLVPPVRQIQDLLKMYTVSIQTQDIQIQDSFEYLTLWMSSIQVVKSRGLANLSKMGHFFTVKKDILDAEFEYTFDHQTHNYHLNPRLVRY